MDLKGLITENQCECLGGTYDFPLEHVFTDGGNSLNSDFDDQLIFSQSARHQIESTREIWTENAKIIHQSDWNYEF